MPQTAVLKRATTLKLKKILRESRKSCGERYWQAKPKQLSQVDKSNVTAIARALSMNPDAILFGEPPSALDPEMVGEVPQV